MLPTVAPPPNQFLRSEAIRSGMDLLMFPHKSHLNRADAALAARGLGRAHHRALYFLWRRPGQKVGELIDTLGIAKQSFGRVKTDLERAGLIKTRRGRIDQRQRLIYLTDEGRTLEHDLFEQLHQNMARAYAAAGEQAVKGYWTLMQHLMDADAHSRFLTFADQ